MSTPTFRRNGHGNAMVGMAQTGGQRATWQMRAALRVAANRHFGGIAPQRFRQQHAVQRIAERKLVPFQGDAPALHAPQLGRIQQRICGLLAERTSAFRMRQIT